MFPYSEEGKELRQIERYFRSEIEYLKYKNKVDRVIYFVGGAIACLIVVLVFLLV